MLVLTRTLTESIVIDGGIEIKVIAIKGDRVRLAISAPKECKILRSELLAKPESPTR
jgi:carbon storage regulator